MKLRIWVKVTLPIAILAIGYFGLKNLSAKRQDARQKAPETTVTPVETTRVNDQDGRVTIYGLGTLKASQTLTLQAQVSGPITVLNDSLVAGGRVKKGDVLFEVDKRDYTLMVAQRKAQLTAARTQLKQEQGRQAVAKKEWALMGSKVNTSAAGRALALREPQIKAARATIQGARSAVDIAELALERTVVKAPFDAVIQSESLEMGQRVGPGQALAQLVGTSTWWAEVSLPMDQLSRIQIPGAKAIIKQDPESAGRVGRVVRRLPQVDPGSQMARLIIEVDDPLSSDGGPPLFLGAGVQIAIEGQPFTGVVRLPRTLLRGGSSVWGLSEDNALKNLPVDIVWRERDHILVRNLDPGTEVITSRIANAAIGQPLRAVDSTTNEAPGDVAKTKSEDVKADPSARQMDATADADGTSEGQGQ